MELIFSWNHFEVNASRRPVLYFYTLKTFNNIFNKTIVIKRSNVLNKSVCTNNFGQKMYT